MAHENHLDRTEAMDVADSGLSKERINASVAQFCTLAGGFVIVFEALAVIFSIRN